MDGRGGEGQGNFNEVERNEENDEMMELENICSFECSLPGFLVD